MKNSVVETGARKAVDEKYLFDCKLTLPGLLRSGGLLALATFCTTAYASPAKAQLIQQYFPDDLPGYAPDFTISTLNRMYYQQTSPGVELGGFVIRPEISENAGDNSNTLGEAGSASSLLESRADAEIDSDWERDSLKLNFYVDNIRYFEVPAASYTNWQAQAAGSFLLGNDRLKYQYAHSGFNLAATSLGVIGVTTPVGYTVDDMRVAYLKLFSRFSLTPAFEFENVAFGKSGGNVDPSYANITHHSEFESVAGRYEATPGNAAILILRGSQAQFPNAPGDHYLDEAGFAGIDFAGDGILQLRALAGVEHRSFSSQTAKSATIPTFEIAFLWMPTQLDTFNLTGIRRLDDPISPFALDSKILDGRLGLDHELREDVFLSAYAEIQKSDSALTDYGSDAETQTQFNGHVSANWNVTSHITASLSYDYNTTSSHANGAAPAAFDNAYPNFDSQTILIGVKFYE